MIVLQRNPRQEGNEQSEKLPFKHILLLKLSMARDKVEDYIYLHFVNHTDDNQLFKQVIN